MYINIYCRGGFSFSLGSDSVLSLVLRALSVSVHVRVYVSVCSFALLAGGRIYHPVVLPFESTHTVVTAAIRLETF